MTVEQFVAQQLGYNRGFGPHAYMGFEDGDGLVAGVIYHNWMPENGVIEISAASRSRKWLTKERLKAIFAYPFEDCKCRLVLARISAHNARARKIWRSLGADEYVIPELRAPNEAECVYVLSADAWQNSRYMRGNHGQTFGTRAA